MAGEVIKVEGLRELQRSLRDIGDKGLPKALRAANKTISDEVVARALPNVPVGRTGNLKRSVKALASQRGASAKAGNANVKYAATIHWGRKKRGAIAARPFLHNAAKAVGAEAPARYLDEVDKVIKQAGLR